MTLPSFGILKEKEQCCSWFRHFYYLYSIYLWII